MATSALVEITPEQRYQIIHQVVEGVCTLHWHNIAHLDLSGTNIMVNIREGAVEARLIDFGSCRFFGPTNLRKSGGTQGHNSDQPESTAEGEPLLIDFDSDIGHLTYRSPEAFIRGNERQRRLDPIKIDVWGLGVIIYEVLMGYQAWESKFGEEVRLFVQSTSKVENFITKGTPITWQVLLACCMRPNPNDRWSASTMQSFLNNYEKILKQELAEMYA